MGCEHHLLLLIIPFSGIIGVRRIAEVQMQIYDKWLIIIGKLFFFFTFSFSNKNNLLIWQYLLD